MVFTESTEVLTSLFTSPWRSVRLLARVLKRLHRVLPSDATVSFRELLVGSAERALQSLKNLVI
jgi:hypothetical protein